MKKVLLFPGAFNPPHFGHVSAVETALKKLSFDEVWIMPSGRRNDKAITTSYKDRHKLGEIFVEYLQTKIAIPAKLITAELDDEEGRNTQEILKEVKSQPEIQFTQLIGLDGYLKLREISPNELDDESFVIIKRPGYEVPTDFPSDRKVVILGEVAKDISSAQIRLMVKGQDMNYKKLIPEQIASYIVERNLYL